MSSSLAISTSRPRRSGFSHPPRETIPAIVAESLAAVASPLAASLRPSGIAEAGAVTAAITGALARPAAPGPFPEWLHPGQRLSCAQLLPMLERYRCALLADPAGSGKTWVALAVAKVWNQATPVTVLAPAAILTQWQRTADRVGVTIELDSHERLSRGGIPPGLAGRVRSGLVIVDESHHFRNRSTRRYHNLAPLLQNRLVLLLSGTPVVNRLSDLAAQLLLGARDDALRSYGIASLARHLGAGRQVSTAIGELILSRTPDPGSLPARLNRRERPHGLGWLEERCARIEGLKLSPNPATAALLRSVFLRLLSSSDAAFLAALRRYRALLLHARDALHSGRSLNRDVVKLFVGEEYQQLVMWEILEPSPDTSDLVLEDLAPVESLIEEARVLAARPDEKCLRLQHLVSDRRTTLVFTVARDTVRYLRDHIPGAAWCTGQEGGIGFTTLERDAVLSWFRPGRPAGGPTVLITTDVSSEGLDLQSAERVVHYDLPWTAIRLHQRNGRALRLGSTHDQVELVRFDIPGPLERRLGQLGAVARKRRLPRKAGLDRQRSWTWREGTAARYGGPGRPGTGFSCCVPGEANALLAGFRISAWTAGKPPVRLASILGVLDESGSWSEAPSVIDPLLQSLAGGSFPPHRSACEDQWVHRLAEVVRPRMEALGHTRWSGEPSPGSARLVARLNRLAGGAVKARDRATLTLLEQALLFVRGGHTAGEAMQVNSWTRLPDRQLIEALRHCPPGEPFRPVFFAELTGLIIFERKTG